MKRIGPSAESERTARHFRCAHREGPVLKWFFGKNVLKLILYDSFRGRDLVLPPQIDDFPEP